MSKPTTIRAKAIGLRLYSGRRALGLTQAEFAEAIVNAANDDGCTINLTDSAVAHWEAGRSEPALRYRRHIAKVLDADRRELFPLVGANEAA